MPLPTDPKCEWPPRVADQVSQKINLWSAWHSGDADELSTAYAYGNVLPNDPTARAFFEEGKRPGESSSTVARAFWGQPPSPGTQRTKLHLPLAGDIAELSASLLFSDAPKVTSTDKNTQKQLDIFQSDGFHNALRESAEICAALGGVFLRVVWDQEISPHPWLNAVHPDVAYPLWSWDRLAAVIFWNTVHEDDENVYRLLEMHEIGTISYGLYQGSATQLGERIPLVSFEGTARLGIFLGPTEIFQTGLKILTAEYIPNMKPAKVWRRVPYAANLGRSDFAGVEPLMDALDETYTSLMRDLRLAKSRIFIPQTMLETAGPGQGALFDMDKEAFIATQGLSDSPTITFNQFQIRVTEHLGISADLIERIVKTAGYSMQSFGDTGKVAVTATEVVARKEQSLSTRGTKILYWRPGLGRIFSALLGIDQKMNNTKVDLSTPIVVDFPSVVQEDPKTVADTLQILVKAKLMSREIALRKLHPDWSDTQITDEVARLMAEQVPLAALNPPAV